MKCNGKLVKCLPATLISYFGPKVKQNSFNTFEKLKSKIRFLSLTNSNLAIAKRKKCAIYTHLTLSNE